MRTSPNSLRWPLMATLLVGALALPLSGCAIRVVDPTATSDIGVDDAAAGARPSSTAADPSDGPDASATDASTPGTGTADADRAAAIASATSTVSCSPGLVLDQPASIIRVEGDCDDVTVAADGAVVILDDVATLRVTADAALVMALGVGTLLVSGSADTVQYTGTAPTVTDTGAANLIERIAS